MNPGSTPLGRGLTSTAAGRRALASPDRTKSLKTPSTRRNVPVHDELIKLGFLDYVTDCLAPSAARTYHQS